MQMEYYRRYIEERPDLILAGLYGDHGKSGRSMKERPELNRLLGDCREGKIDLILTKSVSRFARNLPECLAAIRELKAMQVDVYFEKEHLNTGDEKGELFLSILATIAQEESRNLAQNLEWSRIRHYEMGQPFEKASYGYRSKGPEHRWVIEENEAKRVRQAFYLAGKGHKYPQILAALNALETKEATGKIWRQTPLVNLLTNVSYIGDFLSNKECTIVDQKGIRRGRNRGHKDQFYIEDHHEPLVSRELFAGVGELIQKHLLFEKKHKYLEEELVLLEKCRQLVGYSGGDLL
jgi:DNA invertase Pin-like site-specific DNA recombinase